MTGRLPEILTSLESLLREAPIVVSAHVPSESRSTSQVSTGVSFFQALRSAETHLRDAPPLTDLSDAWKPASPGELESALQQVKALAGAPACPIVAVLGMLNAGKSSLVATFLAADSNGETRRGVDFPTPRRVLIGSANREGTHRFVLWLPQSWREQASVWAFLHERLASIFGAPCEALSDDPDEAARQYNDMQPRKVVSPAQEDRICHPIEIPLIATDPNLDRLGIALMDCPDVQTGLIAVGSGSHRGMQRFEELSAAAADARFRVLARSATLCSAFIVVLPANALHDQTVSRLLRLLEQRMPHVQRILAVNRVPRRYSVDEIRNEVERLYRSHSIRRLYLAYNFDGPLQRDRLPAPPESLVADPELPLPLFFRIDSPKPPQPPEPIPSKDWMIHLGSQLEVQNLLADAMRSATSRLAHSIHAGIQRIRAWVQWSEEQLEELQRVIADACLDFSLDPESPASSPRVRLQASRQIVQQIAESLERTAPWWARPGRWVQRLAQASKESVSGAISWLRMPGWISERGVAMGDWIRGRFKRGESGSIVTADALCDALAQRDRQGILGLDHDSDRRAFVRIACQRAIDRFQDESATRLQAEQIDALTQRIWSEMPVRQRLLSGLAPAGVLFAPLLAVIMVPLDFGGSTVLVFASLKELLFAGAAGVGLVLASADSMPHLAESESAWQQLADLVAVVTDEFGLERRDASQGIQVSVGTSRRALLPSGIPIKRNAAVELPGASLGFRRMEESNVELLLNTLQALEDSQRA